MPREHPGYLPGGTDAQRVRLTVEQAERGVLPQPLSRAEWDAMHRACQQYHDALTLQSWTRARRWWGQSL